MNLFELRGRLESKTKLILELVGLLIILGVWSILSYFEIVSSGILPPPWKVLFAYPELHFDDALVRNTLQSIGLNMGGYLEALVIALPIGFIIGLVPLFRGLFSRYIDSLRFLPLTAVTGLFIVWFGIGTNMKVQFLAFGIFVYLLPVVVQRIDEVQNVYLRTAFTLGASKWQLVKTVYVPSVVSRISDDVRVLVAISWTYIIIAEMLNSTGGIGALIYKASRQGRIDKVFAILIVIVLIGFIQDKVLAFLDRMIFPHKHLNRGKK